MGKRTKLPPKSYPGGVRILETSILPNLWGGSPNYKLHPPGRKKTPFPILRSPGGIYPR